MGEGSDEMSCDPAAITCHLEEKVGVDTPLMLLWNGGVRLMPFEKSKKSAVTLELRGLKRAELRFDGAE